MADASRVPLGVILVRRDASPVHPGETTHTIDNMATDETGRRKCRKQAGERRGGEKKGQNHGGWAARDRFRREQRQQKVTIGGI